MWIKLNYGDMYIKVKMVAGNESQNKKKLNVMYLSGERINMAVGYSE